MSAPEAPHREAVTHRDSIADRDVPGIKGYLVKARRNLIDFQENHGLPRTEQLTFFSLSLGLAQETGRALYAILMMVTQLLPILSIFTLILRFILDKV